MSVVGSDDDFLATNTPNLAKKTAPSTSKTRGNNNSNRAEAGPSRVVNATTSNKRKKGTIFADQEQSDNDEVEEVVVKRGNPGQNARGKRKQAKPAEKAEVVEMVEEGDEESGSNEVEEIIPPTAPKVRGGSKKPESRSGPGTTSRGVNGSTNPKPTALVAAAAAKSKGKQKAKPTPAPKKSALQEPEIMEIDEDAPVEDMDMDEDVEQTIHKSGRSGGMKPGKVQHPPPPKKDEQVARLEKQLQHAQEHIKDLKRQLDEFVQVRKTEPELLMERMEAQHQAQNELKDTLLKQLQVELGDRDSALRSGKKSAFELISREEADYEMQSLHAKIKAFRDALSERDERDRVQRKEIETLEEDKRILSLELKEEVRRAQELVARQPPPSSSRSRSGAILGPSQDPRYAQIVTFYEDLTNVIVPSMKMQPGRHLDTEEWILNCCYTHKDVVNKVNSSPKSINFILRLCYEPKPGAKEPITNQDDLVPSVHYTPLELQNESAEFVASLGFLGDNFTFERDQLSLFVRTLHDYVSGEGDDAKSEASDDSSVQILE